MVGWIAASQLFHFAVGVGCEGDRTRMIFYLLCCNKQQIYKTLAVGYSNSIAPTPSFATHSVNNRPNHTTEKEKKHAYQQKMPPFMPILLAHLKKKGYINETNKKALLEQSKRMVGNWEENSEPHQPRAKKDKKESAPVKGRQKKPPPNLATRPRMSYRKRRRICWLPPPRRKRTCCCRPLKSFQIKSKMRSRRTTNRCATGGVQAKEGCRKDQKGAGR